MSYRALVRCSSGKRQYKTRHEAKIQLGRFQTGGFAVHRVYRCPECRDYHLTKSREPTRDPR